MIEAGAAVVAAVPGTPAAGARSVGPRADCPVRSLATSTAVRARVRPGVPPLTTVLGREDTGGVPVAGASAGAVEDAGASAGAAAGDGARTCRAGAAATEVGGGGACAEAGGGAAGRMRGTIDAAGFIWVPCATGEGVAAGLGSAASLERSDADPLAEGATALAGDLLTFASASSFCSRAAATDVAETIPGRRVWRALPRRCSGNGE